MPNHFQTLRLRQLDRSLLPLQPLHQLTPPPKGWLRAIRQAMGLSAGEVSRTLGVSRQLPLQLEKSEAEDTITLKSLRSMANALDCDLVYAILPRAGSMSALVEQRLRTQATQQVLSVEHSMALEDQASGNLDDAIADSMALANSRLSK